MDNLDLLTLDLFANRRYFFLFLAMQQDQPQFYANLASHLSAEEQGLIQDILVKAEEVAQAQLQAQQAEAAANGGAN